MYKFVLKEKAVKEIEKLPSEVREKILKKLKFFASCDNPLKFAEKIRDYKLGQFRFRIGNYRVICDVEENKIIILKIGHRKDIYK